jgi:DNA-binding CsgD family transcriptional regulator
LRIATRRQFHRAVGSAIEAVYRADLDPYLPELARHFQAAGGADIGRGIDYAVRAGRRADELLAFEDAVQFFRAALDAMEQRSEPDDALRCTLLFLLGEAQRKANDRTNAQATLLQATDTASGLGEFEVSARAALAYELVSWLDGRPADPPAALLLERVLLELPASNATLRAQVAGALARAYLYAGDEAKGRAQAAQAIAMARALGDPAVSATNLWYLFDFPWGPESTEEYLGYATEMLSAAKQTGNVEMVAVAHSWRLSFYLELGDMPAVEAELDALTRVDALIRQVRYSLVMFGSHTMLALLRGEFAEAERVIVSAMGQQRHAVVVESDQVSVQIFSLRREQGLLAGLQPMVSAFVAQHAAAATWKPGLALVYLEVGQREAARALFEQLAAHDFAAIPRDGRWRFCLVYLSEICAALGDVARAAMLYRLLLPLAGRTIVLGNAVGCCGSAGRFLGMLCATMSRWAEAQRYFEEALAMNATIGARPSLAHTQHDYATMLLARAAAGDRERAAKLLGHALDSARSLGMRALEVQITARLDGIDTPAKSPDELTARELAVLRLVAIGRSNADVAMALSISVNTVATHVRNVLAKTGCANRTEAAAYAMRIGLSDSA